ncbi:class II aldolase/adducin family protein [Acidipropionibacterium timonense]|uniref:class II aldolase/adducin family protein n=1 Tax=Acidipropionibacterium timonense TaxID=2161818 RepID=UPI00102F37D5|nr:class II aldolase/adducin family protein [Acidipropionibacterium timonense]
MGDEQVLRAQICEFGRNLWTKNMVAANDGNISVRLNDDRILCTPTGVSKGYMRPEKLAELDLDGNLVNGCTVKPSSEVKMHLRVYVEDPSVKAVVHAHPLYATLFATRGMGLRNTMLPETIVGLGDVPLAPYATPSTHEVPDSIAPFIAGHMACLLENHGALTWGKDLMSAYLAMERLESSAHQMWALELVGGGNDLPSEEVFKLRALFGVTS